MSGNNSSMTDSLNKSQWSILITTKPNVATEDHLQSLGLDVNHGLPKFKLNEPGPAALQTSIFQQNSMVNDESEQSFVVLGKTSLESIREKSLATYMNIQQKSSCIDHTPLISMMSPSEVEENLKKVLEENTKLKETLEQNNTAIKQQFNTITMWQKEVIAICDDHKQKFEETKELISRLKNENNELREQISKNQSQTTSITDSNVSSFSPEINNINSSLKKSSYHSTENLLTLSGIIYPEEISKSYSDQSQSNNEQQLLKKIDSLSCELNQVKMNHLKTEEVLKEMENRYTTDIDLFSQHLQKANKQLEISKQKSDLSHSTELQKLVTKCCDKDREIKYLTEIITSLEQQIKKLEENSLPLIDLEVETTEGTSSDKLSLKENVEFYNIKMRELTKCFSSQCSRYLRIQELLKESAEILQAFENAEVLPNSILSEDKVKDYKDQLYEYRKKLIDEQVQSVDDKQTTIKIQKQFQKILSDYNIVLYELEILKDENSKLTTVQTKTIEENAQKLAEIEKQFNEERKCLDNEKADLLEERLNLQMEKKLVIEEKQILETERNSILIEKERVTEERACLLDERASLDCQSRLYEAEEGTLQNDKKILHRKCEDLTREINHLKEKLGDTIELLHINSSKLKENEEIISVYKIQMDMYEKEFDEMRITQRNFQDQLQSLSMANLELRTENERLGGHANEQTFSNQQRYCSCCAKYISSGERHGIGICTPEFD